MITTKQSGPWNNPDTWEGGKVPTAADPVTIYAGLEVFANEETTTCETVDIFGSLRLTKSTLSTYGNVNVRQEGNLLADQSHVLINTPAGLTFIGGDAEAARADVGLWIEGSARFLGTETTPWVESVAAEPFAPYRYGVQKAAVAIKNRAVRLSSMPIGWKPGDVILIASPEGRIVQNKLIAISPAPAGATYNAEAELSNEFQAYAVCKNGKFVFPKIVNLTRSAGVIGNGITPETKPHVMVLHHGTADFTFAEIVDCGPRGVLGRYPFHVHHTHHPCALVRSSIYSLGRTASNRGVAIHDSPNNLILGNVVYRAEGHAFFCEDPKGKETGNNFSGNLAIDTNGSASAGQEIVTTPEKAEYNRTASFWMRPGNTNRNNTAIGGAAVGMVVMPGVGGKVTTVENFAAWGVGRYGLQAACNVEWLEPVAVNCEVSGYGSPALWDKSDTGSRFVDPFFVLNGIELRSAFLTDTDRAYVSQVFLNQARDILVEGGTLAGPKCLHEHYTSAARLIETAIEVDVLSTPTYFESDAVFDDCEIVTKQLADAPYSPRRNVHGRIRLRNCNYNGAPVDETYTSTAIATAAGQIALALVTDAKGAKSIAKVANLSPAGFLKLPATTAEKKPIKYLRYWNPDAPITSPAPPISYAPLAVPFSTLNPWEGYRDGMIPGRYYVECFSETWDARRPPTPLPQPVLVTVVEIRPGETTVVS